MSLELQSRLPVLQLILCACTGLGCSNLASASSLTVPDDSPTIQAAVDAQADSVYIRPGEYPESVVLRRQIVIAGLKSNDDSLPEVTALAVQPDADPSRIPDFVVRNLHVSD